jgi:hypothetical protein
VKIVGTRYHRRAKDRFRFLFRHPSPSFAGGECSRACSERVAVVQLQLSSLVSGCTSVYLYQCLYLCLYP